VLYQKSEGSALGLGQSGLFSGRGQANALTRATAILATIFFITSIALTVLPAWERRAAGGEDWTTAIDQKLTIKEVKPQPEASPETGKAKTTTEEETSESIFDQLKRAQEKRRVGPQTAPQAVAPAEEPKSEPQQPPVAPKSEAGPKGETAPQAPNN
jgi:preprotein translocase subunit SecG